jgi:hypothetical protein
VDVVSHQTIGVHLAIKLLGELFEMQQVEQVVAICAEARRTVVPALDDVSGDLGKNQPRLSRHACLTAGAFVWLTGIGL